MGLGRVSHSRSRSSSTSASGVESGAQAGAGQGQLAPASSASVDGLVVRGGGGRRGWSRLGHGDGRRCHGVGPAGDGDLPRRGCLTPGSGHGARGARVGGDLRRGAGMMHRGGAAGRCDGGRQGDHRAARLVAVLVALEAVREQVVHLGPGALGGVGHGLCCPLELLDGRLDIHRGGGCGQGHDRPGGRLECDRGSSHSRGRHGRRRGRRGRLDRHRLDLGGASIHRQRGGGRLFTGRHEAGRGLHAEGALGGLGLVAPLPDGERDAHAVVAGCEVGEAEAEPEAAGGVAADGVAARDVAHALVPLAVEHGDSAADLLVVVDAGSTADGAGEGDLFIGGEPIASGLAVQQHATDGLDPGRDQCRDLAQATAELGAVPEAVRRRRAGLAAQRPVQEGAELLGEAGVEPGVAGLLLQPAQHGVLELLQRALVHPVQRQRVGLAPALGRDLHQAAVDEHGHRVGVAGRLARQGAVVLAHLGRQVAQRDPLAPGQAQVVRAQRGGDGVHEVHAATLVQHHVGGAQTGVLGQHVAQIAGELGDAGEDRQQLGDGDPFAQPPLEGAAVPGHHQRRRAVRGDEPGLEAHEGGRAGLLQQAALLERDVADRPVPGGRRPR